MKGLGFRVVLNVLVKKGHLEYTSLKGDPNQIGNYLMAFLGTVILNNHHVR